MARRMFTDGGEWREGKFTPYRPQPQPHLQLVMDAYCAQDTGTPWPTLYRVRHKTGRTGGVIRECPEVGLQGSVLVAWDDQTISFANVFAVEREDAKGAA